MYLVWKVIYAFPLPNTFLDHHFVLKIKYNVKKLKVLSKWQGKFFCLDQQI